MRKQKITLTVEEVNVKEVYSGIERVLATALCRRTIVAALVLACLGGMVVVAQENPDAAKVKNPLAAKVANPVASTPESIAAGKQVFQKSCAPCHGRNAEGGPGNDLIPAAPSLIDEKWDHGSTDGEIFEVIKNGVGPDFNMTPWKDQLKDADIWNVVNYLRSIAKNKQEPAKTNSQPAK